MYSWMAIQPGTLESERYLEKTRFHFPKPLPRRLENLVHLAILQDGEIVGGVTLQPVRSLAEDPDVLGNWWILRDRPGTRLLRLWASTQFVTPYLFNVVRSNLSEDTYVYGILSLPPTLVHERATLWQKNLGWMLPRTPHSENTNALSLSPTSDGKRLLSTYLRIGVDVLALPAVSSSDSSVKVILGALVKDVQLIRPQEVYVAAHS